MARRCWCTAGEVRSRKWESGDVGKGGVCLGFLGLSCEVTGGGKKVLIHCWGGEEPNMGVGGNWGLFWGGGGLGLLGLS